MWVPSLVRELRSHKLHGAAKKKTQSTNPHSTDMTHQPCNSHTLSRVTLTTSAPLLSVPPRRKLGSREAGSLLKATQTVKWQHWNLNPKSLHSQPGQRAYQDPPHGVCRPAFAPWCPPLLRLLDGPPCPQPAHHLLPIIGPTPGLQGALARLIDLLEGPGSQGSGYLHRQPCCGGSRKVGHVGGG